MFSLILSLFAFSPDAHATNFCAGLELLHAHIFFCKDNAVYAKHAEQCKEQFKEEAQAKSVALQEALAGNLATASGEAQKTHFKKTQGSYESTDQALAQVIDTGRHARAEVVGYGNDFVAPFGWPVLDLGPWPGLHHPAVQDLFRSQGCYKDNIEAIDRTTAEFDQMIHDLESTRAIATQLRQRAHGRELSLAELSALPLIGAQSPRGKAQTGASDVTGTARASEPKGKSGITSGKMQASGSLLAGQTQSSGSRVTKSPGAPLRATDAAGLFSVALDPSTGGRVKMAPIAAGATQSVSAVSALLSALGAGGATTTRPLRESSTAPADAGGIAETTVRVPASESSAAAVSFSADSERDLFSLVHERYRATEIFRHPSAKD
jgi:hypothetical protein